MIEESKYYTPSIEEFHVGFEYEIIAKDVINNDSIWIKHINPYRIEMLESFIENKQIKVKYLDRSDIESLGWKQFADHDHTFNFGEYQIDVQYDNQFTQIYDFKSSIIFEGIIKNRSELKRLMKQLQITE